MEMWTRGRATELAKCGRPGNEVQNAAKAADVYVAETGNRIVQKFLIYSELRILAGTNTGKVQ